MNKQCVATVIIFTLIVLALTGCISDTSPGSGSYYYAYPTSAAPSQLLSYNQDDAYAAAQATLVAGQNEMMALSHQGTLVSLNINQAANSAAQITKNYNQLQKMELSIHGTEVSQNMARAAATQRFITEQTQIAWNENATAQSQAATNTYSKYILNLTQTAQAQAMLDVQSTHTAQVDATQTAYSLTATPFAALQAEIVRSRNEAGRRAWWGEFVVTPLKLFLSTMVVVLLIIGGVMAYRRLLPILELRLRTITRDNDSPFLLVDGMIVDPDPPHRRLTQWELHLLRHPQPAREGQAQVEIIAPSEPSVTNWITEAEQKLFSDGWMQT